MLQLPNLNDRTLEDLVENAIKQIKIYGDFWNDTDAHDPGITFIELLAYLTVLQQESADKVGERSLAKFAGLLGVERQKAVPARAYVRLMADKDVYLPESTRFNAFGNIYETAERMLLSNNRIQALGTGGSNSFTLSDYDEFSSQRNMSIFGDGEKEIFSLYVFFEKALYSNEKMNFHIELHEYLKRNEITNSDEFIPLSKIRWQYYGEENGETGWHDAEICYDATCQMLFSGIVSLKIKGEHKYIDIKDGVRYAPVRVKAEEYGYEARPVLKSIRMNVFELVQTETFCREIDFSFREFAANNMIIDLYTAFDNRNVLFVKEKNGFVRADDIGILYAVKREENNHIRLGTSDRIRLFRMFENAGDNDIVLKLVCYSRDFYDEKYIGSGTGAAEQTIWLEPRFSNIVYDDFDIMLRSKTPDGNLWHKWEKTTDFHGVGPRERKYVLNPNKGAVQFGNNINGKAPSILKDNIIVTNMRTTKDIDGLVQKGSIKSIENDQLFGYIEAWQFTDAFGAVKADGAQEFLDRTMNSINVSDNRAVTAEDYKNIVKNTQGLIVEGVTVIPLYRPYMENYPDITQENAVTVVVEPPGDLRHRRNLKNYIDNIKMLLDKVRMITTKVYVITPQYFGVDIYADIVVSFDYNGNEGDIKKVLSDYINNIQKEKLGCTLYHGDFFAEIENIANVIAVNYMKMELTGSKIRSNNFGDISIPPYAKAYIKNVFLTLNYK